MKLKMKIWATEIAAESKPPIRTSGQTGFVWCQMKAKRPLGGCCAGASGKGSDSRSNQRKRESIMSSIRFGVEKWVRAEPWKALDIGLLRSQIQQDLAGVFEHV